MRDGLDRAGMDGLGRRMLFGLTIVVLLLLLLPFACTGIHHMRHPAPFGRSAAAMLQSLDRKIPPGSTVDSAVKVLNTHEIEYAIYSDSQAIRRYQRDSLFAGGPVVVAVQPQMTRRFNVWSGHITLYFSGEGRLAGRRATLSADSPL